VYFGRTHEAYRSSCANAACKALYRLSFINQIDDELRLDSGFLPDTMNIREQLEEYKVLIPDEDQSVLGLLLNRLSRAKPSVLSSDVRYRHVMVSYCWNTNAKPELVKQLVDALRSFSYEVWRDEDGSAYVEKMQGSVDDRMAEAVEHSYAVIICVSEEYKQSDNCKFEANYASARLKQSELDYILFVLYVKCARREIDQDYLCDDAREIYYSQRKSSRWVLRCHDRYGPLAPLLRHQFHTISS
jgi:hypothetical protein